jgi:hypothetical protein
LIGAARDVAIEAFCEQTFGTRWSRPRPPFLCIEGFPADAGS